MSGKWELGKIVPLLGAGVLVGFVMWNQSKRGRKPAFDVERFHQMKTVCFFFADSLSGSSPWEGSRLQTPGRQHYEGGQRSL